MSLLSIYLIYGGIFIYLNLMYLGSVVLIMYVSAVGILFLFVMKLVSKKGNLSNKGIYAIYFLIFLSSLIFYKNLFLIESLIIDFNIEYIESVNELESIGKILYIDYLGEVLAIGLLCLLVVFGSLI